MRRDLTPSEQLIFGLLKRGGIWEIDDESDDAAASMARDIGDRVKPWFYRDAANFLDVALVDASVPIFDHQVDGIAAAASLLGTEADKLARLPGETASRQLRTGVADDEDEDNEESKDEDDERE